ncbi:hypothetical protein ACSDR0_45205 [Streptosporangium sp. G11]|uniref:hypothetical protein n=1 Tax=Streptosporangium sp. G11 TaxID=3436926 RepID=UPI003EB99EF3
MVVNEAAWSVGVCLPSPVKDQITPEMLRNRSVPSGVDHPDRLLRSARSGVDQVQVLRAQPRLAWPKPDALARWLLELGADLEELTWYDLARLAYLEAVEFYRAESANGTNVCRENFHRSLRSLRRTLVQLGRHEEALPIAREEHSASLRLIGGDAYALDDANEARSALTMILAKLGRREEAVESAAAAVGDIRRQPAGGKGRPRAHALAHALADYADRLTRAGRFDEAIEAATERVAFWRGRAKSSPVAYAESLESLGRALGDAGRVKEAGAAFARYVEVYRRQIETGESPLWSGLAGALVNGAMHLASLGSYREALALSEEGVALYREFVARESERQERMELSYAEDDDLQDDRELIARGLEVKEGRSTVRLAARNLCAGLYNQGNYLHMLNRLDQALAVNSEAVEIARGQDDAPRLALALNNRSCVLADLGPSRQEEALEAASEAVAICAGLAVADSAAHERDLALARHTFCVAATNLGRHEEALAASLQCLNTYRRLHESDPHRFAGGLAHALTDHGLVRSRRGDHAEALAATAESVEMCRRLAGQNPARYSGGHANALVMFAEVRLVTDSTPTERQAAVEEAVELYRSLAVTLPEGYAHRLAHARSVAHRMG